MTDDRTLDEIKKADLRLGTAGEPIVVTKENIIDAFLTAAIVLEQQEEESDRYPHIR